MRVAWLSDIHLNFLNETEYAEFLKHVASAGADSLVASGDIAEAPNVWHHLRTLHETAQAPVYFVLGNHDFYGSSIEDVTREILTQATAFPDIVHLNNAGVLPLTTNTCLIGHDSWADGRLGSFDGSDVILNDYFLVHEVANLDRSSLQSRLAELGDELAHRISRHDTQRYSREETQARLERIRRAGYRPKRCRHLSGENGLFECPRIHGCPVRRPIDLTARKQP